MSTYSSDRKQKYEEGEIKKEICLSPTTKLLHQQEKIQKTTDNTTTPSETSIAQRLRTDLGQSVGVKTAIELVWLTGLRPQSSNYRQ